MADKRNLNLETILNTATDIIEKNGSEALTLNALAAALNIKPPSLYNHIGGIDELRRELLQVLLRRMGDAVRRSAVGRSEEDALREIAHAYRRFAKQHPELYRAFVNTPIQGDRGALEPLIDTLRQVMSAFNLAETEEMHFIRLFHSGLHGFVSLENSGFFSLDTDIDESFTRLVERQIALVHP
jgi:AcrR family transcriptional regulator